MPLVIIVFEETPMSYISSQILSGMTTPEGKEGAGPNGQPPQSWVQFEEEDGNQQAPPSRGDSTPAVIDAQAVQVSLENHNTDKNVSRTVSEPVNGVRKTSVTSPTTPSSITSDTRVTMSQLSPAQLHNVPLHDPSARPPANAQPVIRQGFSNGDVIVTLLPQNTSLPWVTPAQFRPELVPEELMAQGLTLTVEDYVHIMSQLVNDYRFTLYNVCYKRILMAWIILGFVILLGILFSGLTQLKLFGAGIGWLMVNAAAIFFCMWVKIQLNKSLERCIAGINLQLLRHKILLGLDDRGKLSCHKVNLCFIYFDTHDCVAKLQEIIEQEERAGRTVNSEEAKMSPLHQRMDIDDSDIIITGATNTRISRQQDRARILLARYSQRWVKGVARGSLSISTDASDSTSPPSLPPRHSSSKQCLCQYIEDHLHYKPQGCFALCDMWQQGSSSALQTGPQTGTNLA
ncbi:transmembrane protein 268-like isoform X1 [Penaeus chinensis]|uniref:transmembrane protein 268-like isoform X1 n=2 Tax=Penaeus chinensis TaxID=139456 RepID=UPI001FB7434B|nr:transmembrane protein 268-like isoform X1 [Penaeus chinensis]XP_047472843.1 transmembrane protein 268-like isoform X1 [Penaeus chinensis]